MASLAILAVWLLVTTGCSLQTKEELEQEWNDRTTQHFRTVEYKGHSYILYEYNVREYSKGGLTHDPDCKKCKEESPFE